jgi:histidinol dehydrogenase
VDIKRLKSTDNNFLSELKGLLTFAAIDNEEIIKTTNDIINQVKLHGDKAVLEYTKKFDRVNTNSLQSLEIVQEELIESLNRIPHETKGFLELSAERIKEFHLKQKTESWSYKDKYDSTYGQKISPLDRVGLYVPGGKAAYPSSVLMNAIPAKIAGVKDLVMVVPTPNGEKK